MPKAMFTQGVAVLTEQPLSIEVVDLALQKFGVLKKKPAEGEKNWVTGYPLWILPMEPHGLAVVEVVDAPWPDAMGGPDAEEDRNAFLAWGVGAFGPHAWPGNLARAVHGASMFGRTETAEVAQRHRAFVRIRSSFVANAKQQAPPKKGDTAELPPYDARRELEFVTSVAQSITHASGSLCYFNPGGETLLSADELDASLAEAAEHQQAPLAAWSGSRVSPTEEASVWYVADTIGMAQLEVQDQEALFERDRHDVNEVLEFLSNVSLYLLNNGPVIENDHTTDGPGGEIWRALLADEGMLPGDRLGVVRWYPDQSRPPADLLRRSDEE